MEDILIKSLELSGKEKLNLRQLLKGIKFPLNAFKKSSYSGRICSDLQLINLNIEALITIFGGLDNDFLSVLKKIKQSLKMKKKSNKEFIYKLFSGYLLKKISPSNFSINRDLKKPWFYYRITTNNDKIIQINKNGIGVVSADFLFLDLLIKYVEEKYYEEKI
ncbi:MAG: hypothetical protein U9O66_01550 [Patescibacteria group bacterium]|nr:hypothetical protein [Patescibacteria group bacterium]